MAITKDIVANYGADPTGVVSCTNAFFTGLKPDMAGQDVNLTIPAGLFDFKTFGGSSWINGALDLNVTATGATLTGSLFLATDHIAQTGLTFAGGKNARIQTANPGATSVTLTTASAGAGYISRFSVGQWCLITGWPIQSGFQGGYGFPPNWQWSEYVKITGIVGNTISFTPALSNYYSAQWPEMNNGTQFETDGAGPATIVGLSLYYGGTSTFNGGSYTNSNLINCYRENFIMNGGISTNLPIYPSVNKLYRAINHTATAALTEHDKLNDWVDIQGGTYGIWKCQSSSTRLLTMTGVTLGSLTGSVKNTVLDTCTLSGDCAIGPTSYGRGETFVARNSSIAGKVIGGLYEKGPSDNIASEVGVQGYLFKSGSVITVPMCMGDSATRTLMPDALGRNPVFWSGNSGTMGYFKPLSVTSDAWPAVDNLTATVGISMANGSKTLVADSAIFTSGDVGKVIFVPGITQINGFSNCTISNASPGVITQNGHGKTLNEPVRFQAGGGTLPSGISAGVTYFVVATNLATNTFSVSTTVGGSAVNTSGGSGTVQVSFGSSIYTFITGFTNSTTVTTFHANSYYSLTSVPKALQWGTCNMYVQTDSTDPLPDPSTYNSSGKLWMVAPPVRSVRFETCTGNDQITDLSQAAAWNRPLDSYTKRQYRALPIAASNGYRFSEAGALAGTGSNVPVQGYIQSLKFNVTKAYTGTQGTLTAGLAQFQINLMINGAWTSYNPRINLKGSSSLDPAVIGERVILIGSTTGAKVGDSGLNLSSPAFIGGGFSPLLSVDISGESQSVWPEFTIEMITDQGFYTGPTAVAPLRFRLHA